MRISGLRSPRVCSRPGSNVSVAVMFVIGRLADVRHIDIELGLAADFDGLRAGHLDRQRIGLHVGGRAAFGSELVGAGCTEATANRGGDGGAAIELDDARRSRRHIAQPPLEALAEVLSGGSAVEQSDAGRRRVAERDAARGQVAVIGDFDAVADRPVGHHGARCRWPGRRGLASSIGRRSCLGRRPFAADRRGLCRGG